MVPLTMTLSKSGAKNIFDCAIAANAEYIVTNDKHFDVLKNIPWPKLAVITIKEFINQL